MGNPHQDQKVEADRSWEGRHCFFVDPVGQEHPALITRIWGPQCANVVIIRDDGQEDQYGLKLERHTSVMHASMQQAHGFYWRV